MGFAVLAAAGERCCSRSLERAASDCQLTLSRAAARDVTRVTVANSSGVRVRIPMTIEDRNGKIAKFAVLPT